VLMYYSIFIILYCIVLAVIFIDGFLIKKSKKILLISFFDFLYFKSKWRYY